MGLRIASPEEPSKLGSAAELSIGVDLSWRVGDPSPDVGAVPFELLTVDSHLAGVLLYDAREAAQECALARAIRPDEAYDLPRLDV